RRAHTRFSRDWSSDVCSSDLHLMYCLRCDLALAEASISSHHNLNGKVQIFELAMSVQPKASLKSSAAMSSTTANFVNNQSQIIRWLVQLIVQFFSLYKSLMLKYIKLNCKDVIFNSRNSYIM